MRALACPASLKGVLTAAEAAAALAEGLRTGDADAVELPIADGGEGTADALWLARGGDWREADVHDAFGAPRRARWLALPDGTAVVEAAAAVPLDAGRLEPLTASSRGFGELVAAALAGGAKGLVLGARRHGHHGRGLGLSRGRSRAPRAGSRRLRRHGDARRGAARLRAAEGSGSRMRSPSSSVASRHRMGSSPIGTSRSPALRAGSARRWRRSARSSSPARHTCSTRSGSTPRRSTSSSPARAASTRRRRSARRPARSCGAPAQRTASSSAAIVELDVPGAETVALSGDPSRARDDLVALGRDLANRR